MRAFNCQKIFFVCMLGLFFAGVPQLFANVCLYDAIEDVYFKGPNEKLGVHQICFNGNEFPTASVENPIFLKIFLLNAEIRLSKTLVDPSSPGLNQPIYLPLFLSPSDQGDTAILVAPSHAVSVTRWVAGENAVWIRIQASTSQWISDEGALIPPSPARAVAFIFGLSAGYYSQVIESFGGNLPYPVRDLATGPQDLSQAESLLWGADFSNHANQATNGPESNVLFGISFHHSDAEITPGVYQDTEPIPVTLNGGFMTARANDWASTGHFCATREIVTGPLLKNKNYTLHAEIKMAKSTDSIANLLPSTAVFQQGSFLSLQLDQATDYGFSGAGAAFEYAGQSSGSFELDAPFILDGQTVYRELKLTWTGDPLPIDLLHLPLIIQFTALSGLNPQQIHFQYRLEQINHSLWLDEPPFDLEHQAINSEPYTHLLDSGLWKPFTSEATLLLPHITRANGGFQTALLFYNTEANAQELQLQPFNSAGDALELKSLQIPPNQLVEMDARSLFEQQEVASVAVIQSGENLRIAAQFQADHDNSIPAQSPGKTTQATHWLLFAGNDSISWDGIAIVNRGATTVNASVKLVSREGSTRQYLLSEIQPDAKATLVLSGLYPGFTAAYYEVEAQEPITLVALRGDLNSNYLWENQVIILPSQ